MNGPDAPMHPAIARFTAQVASNFLASANQLKRFLAGEDPYDPRGEHFERDLERGLRKMYAICEEVDIDLRKSTTGATMQRFLIKIANVVIQSLEAP